MHTQISEKCDVRKLVSVPLGEMAELWDLLWSSDVRF